MLIAVTVVATCANVTMLVEEAPEKRPTPCVPLIQLSNQAVHGGYRQAIERNNPNCAGHLKRCQSLPHRRLMNVFSSHVAFYPSVGMGKT